MSDQRASDASILAVKGSRPTANELVENIGFGKAQLLVLFTGVAVPFSRGVHMCLMAVLTIPVAKDFGFTHNQDGLLSSGMFMGMFVGTIAGGYVADRIGRRFPVWSSSIAVVLIGCLWSAAGSFALLLSMRFLVGFAMGFGDVPATALVSEVSPQRWKIPMNALAEAFFTIGYTYAATLASFADPDLRALHWRKLLLLASVPPGAMGLLAAIFLPESPVWLASSGRRSEAQCVFGLFQRLNGVEGVRVDYAGTAEEETDQSEPAMKQLSIIFGPRFARITLILAYIAFTLNVFSWGGLYAQPQVMTKGRGLAPGWEIVMGGPFDFVGIIAATLIAQVVTRKPALCLALVMAALSSFCFGFAGSTEPRSIIMEILYQFGVAGFYWVPAGGFIIFGQLAVESFPTLCSTTGGSIASCCGRFGAMAGPMLFENIRAVTHRWQIFFYLLTAFSVLGVMLVAADAMALRDPANDDPYETAPCRCKPLADAEAGKGKAL